MQVVYEQQGKMLEIPDTQQNNSYKKYDKEAKTMEYLCYAGGNESMWTEAPEYFDRSCPGKVFGKPCLVLKAVCWFNPWGTIEGVTLPKNGSTLTLCIYHACTSRYSLDSGIIVEIADLADKELKYFSIWNDKWPVKGVKIIKDGVHRRQQLCTVTVPEAYYGKKVAV